MMPCVSPAVGTAGWEEGQRPTGGLMLIGGSNSPNQEVLSVNG